MLKENVYCNQENILNEISIKDSSVRLSQAFDTPYQRLFTFQPELRTSFRASIKNRSCNEHKQDTKRYLKEINFFREMGGITHNV